jgi:tetratricopeptide (TPR) repeat protein/predicted Ser/Thr protein kinase
MDSAHYARVKEAFSAVCDTPPGELDRALDEACAGDAALRAEVEALVRHERKPVVDLDEASRNLLGDLFNLTAHVRPALQSRLGQYELLEVLGEGGMGVVYRARQESPRREVALKVLRTRLVTDSMLRRFDRETEALGRLHHPDIAQIYEAGIDESDPHSGTPYFAMEYVRGLPLLEHGSAHDLSQRERIELMIAVCDAVDYAHRQGVVHRDLKPANILVEHSTGAARPKILDFGIARVSRDDDRPETLVTRTGELLGTLSYMSPEQVSGNVSLQDGRVDVYALGVVLFELLAGRTPHDLKGKSIPDAIRVIEQRDAMRLASADPALMGDLDTIVATALEKDPARRYTTPGDLARDLRRHLEDQPIAAHPPSTMYQFRKFARRNRAVVVGVVAVFIVLLAGMIATAIMAARAQAHSVRAQREADASREVSAFLHDVLTSVDPFSSAGRDVTVEDALSEAVERLDELSSASPSVEASLERTIGLAYQALGEHVTAEPHLRRAMEIRGAALGPDHEDTLESVNELALVLVDLRRLDESEALARDGRERALRLAGRENERYIRLTSAMAISLYWKGDLEGSEKYEREALDLNIALHGEEDRRTLIAMSNLGLSLADMGKFEEAEAMLLRCAELRTEMLGPDHPETLFARANVTKLYFQQGRLDDALPIVEDYVARGRDAVGPTHPIWQAWVRNLAYLLHLQGENERALALLDDARPYVRINGADSHPSAVQHLGLTATVQLAMHDPEGARPNIDEAYAISESLFGPDHMETLQVCSLYVECFDQLGDEASKTEWAERLKGTPFDPDAQ